jgi:CBS domain-containing protein
MSLRTAAMVLSQARVSGAPVIDSQGACVGVISATDFLRRAKEDEQERFCEHPTACVCADWQMVETNTLPADTVATRMTRDPVMAAQETRIQEVARMMLDAHIHRVIILDEQLRPVGIVSSTDVLAALARQEDE